MASKVRVIFVIAAILWALAPAASAQRPVRRNLMVAAAASLGEIGPQLSQAFHQAHSVSIRFNFAGSHTLARQIIEGAPADVFVSADEAQMDAVEHAGRLVERTRFNLLGNRLMIVLTPFPSGLPVAFRPPNLADATVRRVAMGDTEAVPIGVYGRRWLEHAGLWPAVAAKVVSLPSSPAVVAAVHEGRAEAGIVYATDAPGGAFIVPATEGPRIVYPAAAVVGARTEDARAFLAFLRGPVARQIFEAARFTHLP